MAKAAMNINDIQELAFTIFDALPNTIDNQNITLFSDACDYVERLVEDPDLFRLLLPFHHLTYSWANAWGKGFTWKQFLKDIVADGCTSVECTKGQFGPCLTFSNADRDEFCISMVHDD